MGVVFILSAGADLVGSVFSFSPLGETGEGFYRRILPCRLRISSQIKGSPKKSFNAPPPCPSDIPPFSKNENGGSRRDMTPAEKILWQELRANKLGVHFRRHTALAVGAGCKLLKGSSSIFIVTP